MSSQQSLRPLSEPAANIEAKVKAMLEARTPEQRKANDERIEAWEREQDEAKASDRRRLAGIPARYTCAVVGNVPELQGVDMTASMLLMGPQGRGKTYAACAVLNRRAKECTVRFSTFEGILREVQATFNGIGSADQVLSKYRNCACLVIDDLGKEKPTDYAIGQLFALLDWRIANAKQTIVTSNYALPQLMERLSLCGEKHTVAAIMSRLSSVTVEDGGFQRVVFRDRDRRLA